MATYKGIGYETSTGRTRTGTSSDDISFDAKVTATDGVDVTGVGLTVTAGGVDVQAGGLSVDAGGASIVGNTSISGNLTVTGTLISQDEHVIPAAPMSCIPTTASVSANSIVASNKSFSMKGSPT